MKVTASFALALFAIAALVNSVIAISGGGMSMIANSHGASSFVTTFVDNSGVDEFNQILNFDVILVGNVGDYADMRCVTELDVESGRPASARVIDTPVTEYRHQAAGYVGFKAAIRLRAGDVLGKFLLACSFVPINPPTNTRRLNTTVYATINQDEGFVTHIGLIRAFSGFAEHIRAHISSDLSSTYPTAFRISKPYPAISGTHLRVKNPSPTVATSGSKIVFKSSLVTSDCDAYWDDVLYRNSVTATIAVDGSYVDLTFGSPINTSSEILIHCYSVIGVKTNPFLPAILEISYDLNAGRIFVNYAVAVSLTDEVSFSDFLAQTNDISPVQPLL